MSLVFFKVSKDKELERVQTSKKNLHYRRSLIIQDNSSQKLWLINGSKVSQDIRQYGLFQAKELNAKNGFIYQIKDVDPSLNEQTLKIIFEQKSKTQKRIPNKTKSKMKKQFVIHTDLDDPYSSQSTFKKPHYQAIDSRVNITRVKSSVQSEPILESFVAIVKILSKAIRRENTQEDVMRQLNDEIKRFLLNVYSK